MSCSRTYLSLRGHLETVSGSEITTLLGLEPTRVIVKGAQVGKPGTALARQHGWILSTEDWPATTAVGDHLRLLDEVLGDRSLPHDAIDWNVFVFWETENGQGGPYLTTADIAFLARQGLTIDFDIYRTGPGFGRAAEETGPRCRSETRPIP